MPSVFSKIIQGELPCTKIDENEHAIAFLDISPSSEGHTLVVPRRETARLESLTEVEAAGAMRLLQRVSQAIAQAYDGVDYNIVLNNGPNAGQEVPHVHFHIIPRPEGSSRPFQNKFSYSDDREILNVAERIKQHLSAE